ncbi:hypothetical protein AWB81_06988 [Caballeronia arationis]|uniref:flavin reductase family protein n=1 Tax=Caballeronia arationis TaxID=1777142 RepID=UPI00074C7BBA|nr:flavin reductase [Caballeronia arationis]SAL05026.1 hypothetical protein AWB81_06988 [Caballeronia arationis]
MMLGLLDETKTPENLARHPECVVDIPSPDLSRQVEEFAPLTGKDPVPDLKAKQFHFEKDKFEAADFTSMPSELVKTARVAECPMHLEARVRQIHRMGGEKLEQLGGGVAAEVEIIQVHADKAFVKEGKHIDPEKWSALIYHFRHYFRLAGQELGKTFRA